MRILVVTNLYPRPGHETVAQFNQQQFRALAVDHEVSVIAPVAWTSVLHDRLRGRPTPSRLLNADGIDVRYPTYYYPPKMLQHRYGECYLASVRPAFERAVKEFRPDVVLSCFAHPDGWAAVRLAHEAKLPVVTKIIGSDVLIHRRSNRRRLRVIEALRESDVVASVSRDLAKHAIDLGADPDRVFLVPEGIDTDLFHPINRTEARARLGLPADGAVILFVGNLLRSKGAGILVEACAQLARAEREFTCYLVGRGRDEARVRSLIARHELANRVILTGSRPLAELPDWYSACNIVTLPSYSEGIPNVLREAMACGRPFVATRVGGIPEIANPATSVLIEPGSATSLAEALAPMLDGKMADPTEAAIKGNTISWKESAGRLADLLRESIRTKFDVEKIRNSPVL